MSGRSQRGMMKWRLRLLAVVMTAAIGIAGAGADVAGAKAPPAPRPGRWTGEVGAFHLSFTVSKSRTRIAAVRTDYEATNPTCGPPSSDVSTVVLFNSLTIRNGAFLGVTVKTPQSGIAMHFTMRGTFKNPTHMTGTMHETFRFPNDSQPPCDETVPLSANHARG